MDALRISLTQRRRAENLMLIIFYDLLEALRGQPDLAGGRCQGKTEPSCTPSPSSPSLARYGPPGVRDGENVLSKLFSGPMNTPLWHCVPTHTCEKICGPRSQKDVKNTYVIESSDALQ